MRLGQFLTRSMLRRLRILRVDRVPPDPLSPEYLYLVQQTKRISLVQSLDSLRPDSLKSWPFLLAVVVAKWLDLKLTNTLIRSLMNEHDLLKRISAPDTESRR